MKNLLRLSVLSLFVLAAESLRADAVQCGSVTTPFITCDEPADRICLTFRNDLALASCFEVVFGENNFACGATSCAPCQIFCAGGATCTFCFSPNPPDRPFPGTCGVPDPGETWGATVRHCGSPSNSCGGTTGC